MVEVFPVVIPIFAAQFDSLHTSILRRFGFPSFRERVNLKVGNPPVSLKSRSDVFPSPIGAVSLVTTFSFFKNMSRAGRENTSCLRLLYD